MRFAAPSVEDGRLFPYFSMSDASVLAGGHRICYNFGMKSSFKIALAFVAAAWAAAADVVSFPGCPWRETKTVARGDAVRVVDAAGRTLLVFNTEGGAFGRHLVVSQAVDHLVVDARAAFKAGMRKLVFTSANFDPKPYRGRDCTLVTELGGARGTEGLAYFEGHGPGLHYYRSRPFETKGHRKTYSQAAEVAETVESLHLRWDISKAAGPLAFYGARYALERELPARAEKKRVTPELLFHAPFDGSVEAKDAKGAKAPRRAEGLSYAEGRYGKAVRLSAKAKSVLEYAAPGNLVPERGTVSLWYKREWPDRGRRPDGGEIWRVLFANEPAKGARVGSGQLWFWWWGDRLRADQGDDDDQFAVRQPPMAAGGEDWTHLAVTWDEERVAIYLNGQGGRSAGDGTSPMVEALKPHDLLTFDRQTFASFFVGGDRDARQFDGLIDDLRIYSAPLAPEQIREIWRRAQVIELKAQGLYALADTPGTLTVTATSPAGCDLAGLKYCLCDTNGTVVAQYRDAVGEKPAHLLVNLPAGDYALKATDGTWFYGSVPFAVLRRDNPYELTGAAAQAALKAPGVLGDLELVQTLTLDRAPAPDRFRAVGPVAAKRLGGVPYLEAGPQAGDRYALHFNIDTNAPLWVFEIDYPDDAVRTADLIIQKARSPGGDYTMQVGYATGDEYPNTGRILTHRVLYWASDPDVALIAMTARAGAPAALSAVRVYRVKGGALPAAAIREPKPVPPPTGLARAWHDIQNFDKDRLEERQKRLAKDAPRAGWNRVVALYFEDPAIGYDFAVPSDGFLPGDLGNLIDRTAALMKFTGENLLAYPGAWYHGLIGERYNPRRHAPDFLSAWYAKFDREGLFLMPTVNLNTMPVPDGLVTRASMSDGSLHGSVVAIHDTGRPNWGGWHDTPPNFNFHHTEVRRHISETIAALVEQGAGHPSFKGVCMHLTRHCFLWFGDEKSGYNDGTVEAFARAKGLALPDGLKKDPLRGRAYAAWLRANAWDDWLQWRCDVVTDFYVKEARKLAARRPDLKLWLNYMVPANLSHPDFLKDGFMSSAWRGAGLDPVRLTKEIPNLVLGQTMVPADYRWRQNYPSPAVRAHQRVLDTLPGFYANLKGAAFPLVHQHDRYWESPIGASSGGGNTLSCDWLKECPWRVSTINPSGIHALRHFVEPLRYGDVLGLSKGGFLIGTYGMEDVLVPFVQAFRALPAVVMDDVPCGVDDVRVRQCTFNGRSYFYVVNTGATPRAVTLAFPAKTENLVSGETFGGGLFGGATTQELKLGPYELRSYTAPEGGPAVR